MSTSNPAEDKTALSDHIIGGENLQLGFPGQYMIDLWVREFDFVFNALLLSLGSQITLAEASRQ